MKDELKSPCAIRETHILSDRRNSSDLIGQVAGQEKCILTYGAINTLFIDLWGNKHIVY